MEWPRPCPKPMKTVSLAQLGQSIQNALQKMRDAAIIEQQLRTQCSNDIVTALINFTTIPAITLARVMTDAKNISHSQPHLFQQALFNKLCKILASVKPSFTPEMGKTNVVIFSGFPGSGRRTACMKYAHYYRSKGYKPALVCADDARGDASKMLQQNATNANFPCHAWNVLDDWEEWEDWNESDDRDDVGKGAAKGVDKYKKQNCDLIIVDTSEEDIDKVCKATNADFVISIVSSSIGFNISSTVAKHLKYKYCDGAAIITKTDIDAKGVGVLTGFAIHKYPVIFIGTGEHMDEFEKFNAKLFVSRLLGEHT